MNEGLTDLIPTEKKNLHVMSLMGICLSAHVIKQGREPGGVQRSQGMTGG